MTKIAILFFITTIVAFSCGNHTDKIKAGSICTVDDGDGKFGVIKVLVIDDQMAHVKSYRNKYNHRPDKIDIKTLSLGSLNDKEGGIGIGHIPLQRSEFDNWKPITVDFEEVTKEDLIGYEIWKDQ